MTLSEHNSSSRLEIAVSALGALVIANPLVLFLLWRSPLYCILLPTGAFGLLLLGLKVPRSLSWLTVLSINFVCILSVWAYFEVMFRYAFSEYVIDNIYDIQSGYYFNEPNLYESFVDKEYNATYATNAQGYRISVKTDPSRLVKTCDWLFVGDSYTQGAQVEFEQLYTSKLFQYFPSKVILNAGVSGFGLQDEFNYLNANLSNLHPDVVFLQICNFNDFMNVEQSPGNSFLSYLMQYSAFLRTVLYDLQYTRPSALPLGRWTEPFYPSEEQNRLFNVFFNGTSAQKEEDLAAFGRQLRKINQVVTASGARLVVLQIPTKEQLFYRYLSEVLSEYHINPSDVDLGRPSRILGAICDSLSVPLLDLHDGYGAAGEKVFFEYDEHLSDFGHNVTADLLDEFLKDSMGFFPSSRLITGAFDECRYPSPGLAEDELLCQCMFDRNFEVVALDTRNGQYRRLTFDDIDETHPVAASASLIYYTEGNGTTGETRVIEWDLEEGSRTPVDDDRSARQAIVGVNRAKSLLAYSEWRIDSENGISSSPGIRLKDRTSGAVDSVSSKAQDLWRPAFSPHGSKLAYIGRIDENYDIFVLDLLDGTERQMTYTDIDEWDPCFVGDSMIVYSAREADNWDLFLMNLDTQEKFRLSDSKGDEWDPYWPGTGNILYFAGEYGLMSGIFAVQIPAIQSELKVYEGATAHIGSDD